MVRPVRLVLHFFAARQNQVRANYFQFARFEFDFLLFKFNLASFKLPSKFTHTSFFAFDFLQRIITFLVFRPYTLLFLMRNVHAINL